MKHFFKHTSKKQQIVYLLLVVVAVLAAVTLLNALEKQRELKTQQLKEKQAAQQLDSAISATVASIEQETAQAADEKKPAVTGLTYGKSGLQIRTQEVGNAVIIEMVVLDRPGFIAIYDDQKGKPDTLLNKSSFFSRGVYPIVSIAVPTRLKKGAYYHATIQFDADDNGVFDPTIDLPIAKEDSSVITAKFLVQ